MDIVAAIDEALLGRFALSKGICTYIDLPMAHEIHKALQNPMLIPGGCAANTAACMVSLGNKAAFLGCTAGDDIGQTVANGMKDAGIHFQHDETAAPEPGSTRIFCLTTPDGQRTFAAYYGAGEKFRNSCLHDSVIGSTRILYMDGFTFVAENAHHDFLNAARLAQKEGGRVAFGPSDMSVVQKYPGIVNDFLALCDIYLSNETEALAITGAGDVSTALQALQKQGKTGVITHGKEGSLVFSPTEQHRISAPPPVTDRIDTNGAGDHYAAGFLHGLLEGWPLEKCGRLGTLCAADALTHAGARPLQSLQKYRDML